VPTVVLVGDAFLPLARSQAQAVKYPDARLVDFPHPIASSGEGSVREKAAKLADEVVAAFLR
jgi:hypothetical protein